MLVGGRTSSRNRPSTMAAMTLIVVGEYFGSVGFVGVVYRVIESDDFGVVGAVVIVHVVEADMHAVDSSINDRHGHSGPIIACLLLCQVHLVHDSSIAILSF